MSTVFSCDLDLQSESIWHTISATAAAKSSFVYMQEAGHFYAGEGYFTTRAGLDSFLVKLSLSGSGLLEYGGQTHKVPPGHFYWIDCNRWQSYRTDPETGHWNVIWTHFNGATARAYYETYRRLAKDKLVVKLPLNSPMLDLLQTLLKRYPSNESPFEEENHFELDVQTSGLLTQLMVECISAVSGSSESVSIPPVVQEIRSYLVANYNRKITLGSLASRFSINQFYLQKLFKHYTGQSPTEYLIHLRMTKAKLMIRNSHLSISEIAYAVGIDNNSHFTRMFKRQEGMTPQEYRKIWPVV